MLKLYIVSLFLLTGCSHFTFNAPMCDQIGSDPNMMSQECRNYNEEEAQKAFDNTKHERQDFQEDEVKFNKEDKEEK